MKVAVNRITTKELLIKEDILASSWDIDSFDIKFVDNLNISCRFIRINKEILVNVHLHLNLLIICSRCLEEAHKAVEQDFVLNYNIERLGEYLEVDNDIREELLLNFPMKVLCREDCKGLCPICGENLNYKLCNCKEEV